MQQQNGAAFKRRKLIKIAPRAGKAINGAAVRYG
jgi:hypothetical protein